MRNAIDWTDFPKKWEDVIDTISMATPRHLIQRLALAASVYMIWHERNRRTFSDEKRPPALLIKEILAVTRLKMDWERDRKKVSWSVGILIGEGGFLGSLARVLGLGGSGRLFCFVWLIIRLSFVFFGC